MRFLFRNTHTIILDPIPKAAFRQQVCIDKFRFLFSQKTLVQNSIDAATEKENSLKRPLPLGYFLQKRWLGNLEKLYVIFCPLQ